MAPQLRLGSGASDGGGGYGIILRPEFQASFLYAIGLLNSTFLACYLRHISSPFRADYGPIIDYLARLPVHLPVPGSGTDKKLHDDPVTLVQHMPDLHQRLAAKGDAHGCEREQIEREIAHTDRQIDDLVCELCALAAQQRVIVDAEVRR
jgi:hypothetical protein